MSKWSAVLLLISFQIANAQTRDSDLNSMLSTEYSFSASAGEVGIRDSFLKFIADDGILFRPGPVIGKDHLAKVKPSDGYLQWYPSEAFVSHSGELGFTTGPWEYRRNKSDSNAVAFGNFLTVWQKQENGEWKFVIDFGNDNGKPSITEVPLKAEQRSAEGKSLIRGIKREKAAELQELDKQFTLASAKMGIAKTYPKFVNENTRLLRNELFPIIGVKAISDYAAADSGVYRYKPLGGKISSAKDFGFTYGELEVSGKPEKNNGIYNYLRIWKKEGRRWIIIADVNGKLK